MKDYQFRKFKDLYLALTKQRQRLTIEWRKADQDEKREINAKLVRLGPQRDAEFAAHLTEHPLAKFNDYCRTGFLWQPERQPSELASVEN